MCAALFARRPARFLRSVGRATATTTLQRVRADVITRLALKIVTSCARVTISISLPRQYNNIIMISFVFKVFFFSGHSSRPLALVAPTLMPVRPWRWYR